MPGELMNALKGLGKSLILCEVQGRQIVLMQYSDQSLGIERDGLIISVWEPDETDDCVRTFAEMCHLGPGQPLVIVVIKGITRSRSPNLN